VNSISPNSNLTRSSRAPFAGLRVLAVAASIALCASVAGCASDTHMASSSAPSWAATGNNGGKADRYAIARTAVPDSAVEVASAPTPASQAQ
jgi:hypothetical protein